MPRIRQRLLAARDLVHQLARRRDADDAGERVARHGDARKLLRARLAVGDLPPDEVGIDEDVGQEAEAGDDGGNAEVGRLVGDELDVDDVARLGPVDVDGTCERMAEAQVQREHVRVRAVARELPVQAVTCLERDLLARQHRGHGLESRVPAVVRFGRGDPHSKPATCSAARVAAATSSADQARDRPSWCTETTALRRSP